MLWRKTHCSEHRTGHVKVCSIQSCPDKVQAASPGRYLPDFFSGLYVPRAEEGDPGEAEVLVRHEDSHGNEVWLTEVVYKAADVAIETGIYAVHLSILEGEMLHVSLDEIGFRVITATCLKKKKKAMTELPALVLTLCRASKRRMAREGLSGLNTYFYIQHSPENSLPWNTVPP